MHTKSLIPLLLLLSIAFSPLAIFAEGKNSFEKKTTTTSKSSGGWSKIFTGQSSGNKQKIGTAVGGLVGGLLGAKLGKGHKDKTFAIFTATAIGALIGSKIGKQLDERDRQLHAEAIEAALASDVGTEQSWQNPETHNGGKVTAVNAYIQDQQVCKDVEAVITTQDGNTDKQSITGCQDKDGGWTLTE